MEKTHRDMLQLDLPGAPTSITYDERNGYWIVGTLAGMVVVKDLLQSPEILGKAHRSGVYQSSNCSAVTQIPQALRCRAPGRTDLESTISYIHQSVTELQNVLKNGLGLQDTIPEQKDTLHAFALPHTGNILAVRGQHLKLLSPDNGTFPVNDIFRVI